jgi:UDP-glucose 4-epimerase
MEHEWPSGLRPDCVVHTAARVHVMRDTSKDPLETYRATNVEGALRVARAAARHGARRFVFLSSIKALGETDGGRPLSEGDPAHPEDAYGRSKLEAEQALRKLGRELAMEIVVIRPPLVYGPGVRANFLRLMQAVARGVPLPLGRVDARRSLVYLPNLVDAIRACVDDARAANHCFHVTDGTDLSVSQLAEELSRHLHQRARLLPVPETWLRLIGRITGCSSRMEKVVGSLRVDMSNIQTKLDWRPPYSTSEGLAATAHWYLSTYR